MGGATTFDRSFVSLTPRRW